MVQGTLIGQKINKLKLKAANRYNIAPEACHVGHLLLEGLLDRPHEIHQIDGVTDKRETNLSVAIRSMRFADAMRKAGLQHGDVVVVSGLNNLDLVVPLFAAHYNGNVMCAIDPALTTIIHHLENPEPKMMNTTEPRNHCIYVDNCIISFDTDDELLKYVKEAKTAIEIQELNTIYSQVRPKMVVCEKEMYDLVKAALAHNGLADSIVVAFSEDETGIEAFIRHNKGSEKNYRPAVIDQTKSTAVLIMTSGTTGVPKAAIITYDTYLNGFHKWWSYVTDKVNMVLVARTVHWISTLFLFVSSPLAQYTRLQYSKPVDLPALVMLINKYDVDFTVWVPYVLNIFLDMTAGKCDLSKLNYLGIGGSATNEALYHKAKSRAPNAKILLLYGMTELLGPAFEFVLGGTPFGSVGRGYSDYEYKIVDDDGNEVKEPFTQGEMLIRGDASFFKGYLNNEEETKKVITADGWVRTGDIFYVDENGFFFYVERKTQIIKYLGHWISPALMQDVIRSYPGVASVCVVSLPSPTTNEVPAAAVVKKPNANIDPEALHKYVVENMPENRGIYGGLFFMDSLPETSSGKVNRNEVRQMALNTERIYAKEVKK